MKPTELVYSSHDRCEHIHRDWIVQRALESWHNKTLLYLPMSSGARGDQEYSWGTFSGYLDRFRPWGLEPRTFFYDEGLGRGDAQLFFDWLQSAEVVILGGGRVSTGLERYRALGERYFGAPNAFVETLRARRAEGKLTVGFSAGAAQLCAYGCDGIDDRCLGLIAEVVVTLHHDHAALGHLQHLARVHPGCLVFGLPNDAGIAVAEGTTGRENRWQHIEFITDQSWDKPEDHWHIKTRQGLKIEHPYADGRDWKFESGDRLVRVFYRDDGWEAWIKRPEFPVYLEYGSQQPTGYASAEDILRDR